MTERMAAITRIDWVTSRIRAIPYLLLLRHAIKNWYVLPLFKLGLMKKIRLRLNSGRIVNIRNDDEFFNFIHRDKLWARELIRSMGFPIRMGRGRVTAEILGRDAHFSYASESTLGATLGPIIDLLAKDEYAHADPKGRIVVDVGAGIGDTPIYFAFKGAKHVYAFEPYPYAYNAAKRNISINKLGKRVTLLNAGASDRDTAIRISGRHVSSSESDLSEGISRNGKRIPIYSLKRIVEEFGIEDAVLKMDCEGCEQHAIMSAEASTLRKFDQIILEYHHGYIDLGKKIADAGFDVARTSPRYFGYSNIKDPDMYIGIIYAKRKPERPASQKPL